MSIIDDEKSYLEYAIKCINSEIDDSEKSIKDLEQKSRKLTFDDKKRGSHFDINSMLDFYDKKILSLKKSISKPYFGRIDFAENGYSAKKTYIGRSGISSNNNIIVVDWRAPISSLYYDSELGNVSYVSPSGIINGKLMLKRQINIENGELLDAQDTSLVTDDELLKPYLDINADNRMKTIVASIQREQNQIIRKPINTNMIVQGVAGSGKTSVALHRIAYLIYNLNSELSSEQFLVLGPNDYFLNYISSILPELETSPVNQETLISFMNEYIGGKVSLNENIGMNNELVEKYKSSLLYKKLIDNYMDSFMENELVCSGFEIDGQVVFSVDEIKKALFMDGGIKYPNFKRANLYLVDKLRDSMDEIYDRLNKKYRDVYTKLPKDDPLRKDAVHKSMVLSKELKENGIKLLKNYLKKIQKNPVDIYKLFISQLNEDETSIGLNKKDILIMKKETLLNLQKKKIGFEDIPAIIHINYRYTGNQLKYKNVVIDEAQDYGMFHFYAIKEIVPDAKFSIYGDLAQSIYSYRSIDSWESVKKVLFNDNCEILKLSKCYRTTIEITENANLILDKLNLSKAQPVIRHGRNVEYYKETNNIHYKADKIREWIEKGYKTIAIICKTDEEAKKVNRELIEIGLDSKNITLKDNEYNGGIFVLTSFAAKGLEFDAVIVNDASIKRYCNNSDIDKHLLYVANTRALHEEVILYSDTLSDIYEKINDNNKCLIKK